MTHMEPPLSVCVHHGSVHVNGLIAIATCLKHLHGICSCHLQQLSALLLMLGTNQQTEANVHGVFCPLSADPDHPLFGTGDDYAELYADQDYYDQQDPSGEQGGAQSMDADQAQGQDRDQDLGPGPSGDLDSARIKSEPDRPSEGQHQAEAGGVDIKRQDSTRSVGMCIMSVWVGLCLNLVWVSIQVCSA